MNYVTHSWPNMEECVQIWIAIQLVLSFWSVEKKLEVLNEISEQDERSIRIEIVLCAASAYSHHCIIIGHVSDDKTISVSLLCVIHADIVIILSSIHSSTNSVFGTVEHELLELFTQSIAD